MALRTVRQIDLSGKRVLVRVDFNVPIKDGTITDDTRIRAALPTLRYILEQPGCRLIVMSHLGRPKGKVVPSMSLAPVAARLEELLGTTVKMAPESIGPDVERLTEQLAAGQVLLLENTRFHAEEEANDGGYAKKLAALGDVYINDAFGAAHRAHASTEGIARLIPAAAGFLIEKEVEFLSRVVRDPKSPFVAIIGGAKVSTKIAVLESLVTKCDHLVIGGGMAYTFLSVQGKSVGNSLLEKDFLATARSLIDKADECGTTVILPVDHVVADTFAEDATPEDVDDENVPDGKVAMDIGPKTIGLIAEVVRSAKTVVWNGPMGVFEFDNFAKGTLEVAKLVADCAGVTVVGGGDSVAAVNKFGFADRIDHVSTGGGASLEYLEGKVLPGIAALE